MSRGRTIILSDTHLGSGSKSAGSAELLGTLVQSGDRLVINGDVLELNLVNTVDAAWAEYRKLVEVCRQKGVELVTVCGNHDPVRTWPAAVEFFDGKVIVTHGHGFHPAIAPWARNAPFLKDKFAKFLEHARQQGMPDQIETYLGCSMMPCEIEPHEQESTQHHNTRVLRLIFKPKTIAKLFAYWRIIPGLAAAFAARYAPKARFVVFGHSHHQGVWNIAHHTVINTGSYSIPGQPYAVVIENRRLSFCALNRTPEGYRLAARASKTFSLGDADPVQEMRLIHAAFPV